jgi:CheY-like chemotaxis protein
MHKVLVVEDAPKLRELLRGYLERAGFAVLTAGSGAEALELFRTTDPSLVMLDLELPDVPRRGSGAEVADGLVRADPDVDRQERRRGPHPWFGAGCERLRHEAIRAA